MEKELRQVSVMSEVSVAQRFADLVIRIWRGDRTVVEDIKKIMPNHEVEEDEYGIVIRGPDGAVIGVPYYFDPLNALIISLYTGTAWPFLPFFREVYKALKEDEGMSIARRFAEMAIKIWRGDRTVVEDIRRIMPDREIEESEYGFVGKGPNGMFVGFQYGLEPTNALVQLGFLYAGMAWPYISFFHEAIRIAMEMWREEVKARSIRVGLKNGGRAK